MGKHGDNVRVFQFREDTNFLVMDIQADFTLELLNSKFLTLTILAKINISGLTAA